LRKSGLIGKTLGPDTSR